MKYSEINNLQDLEAARTELSGKLKAAGGKIDANLSEIRESCTPMSLFAAGLKTVSGKIPFDRIALSLVRTLIRRFK